MSPPLPMYWGGNGMGVRTGGRGISFNPPKKGEGLSLQMAAAWRRGPTGQGTTGEKAKSGLSRTILPAARCWQWAGEPGCGHSPRRWHRRLSWWHRLPVGIGLGQRWGPPVSTQHLALGRTWLFVVLHEDHTGHFSSGLLTLIMLVPC